MISNKLNIGIIGCGMVGKYHIQNIKKLITVDCIYLCDISNIRLAEVGQKYGIYNLTNNKFDLINNPKINAIIICTPPANHYNLAIECIKANKHILVEKPLVINREQLNHIKYMVNENPNIIVMDCSSRHSRLQPKFNFIKSLISQVLLGEVYFIHHNVVNRASRPGIEYHPEAQWFFQKEISGGGALIDWGTYDIAFHLGILNDKPEFINVKSYLYSGFDKLSKDNIKFNVEEHAICILEFDSLNYYYERASNSHNLAINETRIYGSKGGLKFNYLSVEGNKLEFYYVDSQGHYKKEFLEVNMGNHTSYEADYFAMDKHFIDCLQGIAVPILPISTAIKNTQIILEASSSLIYKF